MPDVLTTEEQDAVAAFLAKNKVTKVPRGVSGMTDADYSWKAQADAGRKLAMAKRKEKAPSPEVAARRVKVSDMIQQGKTSEEVAEALGVGIHIIYADARTLNESFSRKRGPSAARSRHDPRVGERREKVRAAYDGTTSVSTMARALKMKPRTVRDHLIALGLEIPKPRKRTGHGNPEQQAKRERRMAEMPAKVAEGLTTQQLAEFFGVSVRMIGLDCKALGLSPKRATRVKARAKMDERRKTISDLIAKGLTGPEISKRTGYPIGTIRKDLSAMGLSIPRRSRPRRITRDQALRKAVIAEIRSANSDAIETVARLLGVKEAA